MAVGNPLNGSALGLDVERSGLAHRHAPDMHAGLFPCGHLGAHPIAGLDALDALVAHEIAAWEAVVERARAAVSPAPTGLDRQHRTIPATDLIDSADTGGIEGMGLGEVQARAVELGASARAGFDRQAGRFQRREQRPARRIDGGGILERRFGLRLDLVQPRRLAFQEVLNGSTPLALIAGSAGERQVRDPIRTAPRAWNDMLDLQRHVRRATIGAGPIPLLQQVFAHLIPGQRSLLIFHAGDVRGLHRLHIEPHQFLTERGDGRPTAQARDPVRRGLHPMAQARGQPAGGLGAIVEPRGAVAQIGGATAAAERRARRQRLADLVSAMCEFAEPQDMGHAINRTSCGIDGFRLAYQGQPGGPTPRIELDPQRLGRPADPILEPDGERCQAHHDRTPALQQQPRALLGARHQRTFLFVEYEYRHRSVPKCALTGLVTEPRGSLPSGMSATGSCFRSDQNLRRFAFRQHDPDLPGSGTEEASRSGSQRPVANGAGFHRLPWST